MKVIDLPEGVARLRFLGLELVKINAQGDVVSDFIWSIWETAVGFRPEPEIILVLCASHYREENSPEEIWSNWRWWADNIQKGQWADYKYITDRWGGDRTIVVRAGFSGIAWNDFRIMLSKLRRVSYYLSLGGLP